MKRKTMKTNTKTRVLIVDDHPIVRYGISRMLNSEPDMEVCGEVHDAFKTIDTIKTIKPDIIIMDISLKNIDGIMLTRQIRNVGINTPILVLSMHDENLYAEKAIQAGANGYVAKDHSSERLPLGIREIMKGNIFIPENIKENILYSFSRTGNKPGDKLVMEILSDRERQIFIMIGKGYPTRKIATSLSISPKTVDSHRARIKLKLDINDGQQLLLSAADWVKREGIAPPAF